MLIPVLLYEWYSVMSMVYRGKYHWQARSDTNMTKWICTEPPYYDLPSRFLICNKCRLAVHDGTQSEPRCTPGPRCTTPVIHLLCRCTLRSTPVVQFSQVYYRCIPLWYTWQTSKFSLNFSRYTWARCSTPVVQFSQVFYRYIPLWYTWQTLTFSKKLDDTSSTPFGLCQFPWVHL